MRRLLLPLALLVSIALLAACGGGGAETTTTETVERIVTAVVTQIVEGETVEVEVTSVVQVEVTSTPEPVEDTPKTVVICMAQEPNSLLWTESALVTSAVLEAVQEPLVDGLTYDYQPNLVTELPREAGENYELVEVTIGEGDQFRDLDSDTVMTLTSGMTESFSLAQLEGDPLAVEAWDGSELTTVQQIVRWTLIDGLTWEDGEPVTADDVVFSFELASDPNWTTPKYEIERTQAFEAVDDTTFQWTTLPGYTSGTYFLPLYGPSARHVWEGQTAAEILESEQANRDPLAYGAYAVDEWVAGEAIYLTPNPNYAKGEPPLDELIYRFVPDTNQLIAQLASGECDIGTQDAAFEGSFALISGFEEQGLLVAQNVAGTTFEHLDFNTQPVEGYAGAAATLLASDGTPLFQKVEFRQAIAHCLDRQAILDQATGGSGIVTNAYIPPEHPLYPGDDAISIYEFDPATGLELLSGLGWTDSDGDGTLDNGQGVPLSFVHSTRVNPFRERVTQIVQAQLAENCQIETEIEPYGSEFFSDGPEGLVFGRKYDLGEFAWLTGVEPSCELYITDQIPNEVNGWGAQNNTGFSNAEFDAACADARAALDPEAKAAAHAEALRIWTENLPSIVVGARAKIVVTRPEITGIEMDPTANSELYSIESVDINMGE